MSLIITRPSIELIDQIEDYRQEYFKYGEKSINGSCGLAYYSNLQEWLDIVLSIESDKLSRDNVHATTFFSIRLEDNKIIGSIQLRYSLTESLGIYGGI